MPLSINNLTIGSGITISVSPNQDHYNNSILVNAGTVLTQ